jgi:hypothetical protein
VSPFFSERILLAGALCLRCASWAWLLWLFSFVRSLLQLALSGVRLLTLGLGGPPRLAMLFGAGILARRLR